MACNIVLHCGDFLRNNDKVPLAMVQFLYPTHTDTHRLLRFLLDQLSKSSQSSRTRKTSRGGTAAPPSRKQLSSTVQQALVEAHASAHTAEGRGGHEEELPFQTCPLRTTINKTVAGVAQKKPTLVTLQAKPRNLLIPSLLELNAKSVVDRCHSHILNKVNIQIVFIIELSLTQYDFCSGVG